MDEDGRPTKKKVSNLHVASDKSKGILGEAQLDLTSYGHNESKVMKLPLEKCDFEGAYIEIALKGTEAKSKTTPKGGNTSISSE
mmetsp:Transcript_117602/g.163787  ORF Transcript_117602/g.163787 Transcript_117602/m.163787 type:complete len:84 (+) Transcript_117602:216-467(+)|eukprot:CAMPEP_0176402172 /NCGR_PEP_ID=MMETSP0126-20121128/49038_1 /TAXON_ID=141414 ORGANISM="Strombidinopsis acuminatum, Strain SPMC142" /NCGR_SAMPLE_ID=MMETSP0126 /ASSEMBLY_ACC=CAM_ASM_000229 /LENGTH=83 /DNA_ID=CAMNT_0017779575 /DNA_START=214 /DNA_END=465 /DNA_ORIENTATION=+